MRGGTKDGGGRRNGGGRRWRRGLLVAAALGLCATLTPPATGGGGALAAPSRAELDQRLNRLKDELAALSRELQALKARADMPEGATVLLRRMVVRVEGLERSLAGLTGRLEELDHRQRETAERLERFIADTRARLTALELGRPATAGGPTGGPADGTETAAGGAASPRTRPETGDAAATPSDSGETGTTGAPVSAVAPAVADDAGASSSASGGAEPAVDAPTAATRDPKAAYDAAFALLRQGRFDAAQAAFADFLARFPDHPLAANAQYWLGETFYVRKDYARAAEAFLKGYQEHRDRPKAADSLLKLGMSLGALGKNEEACAAFDELERGFENLDPRIRRRAKAERARFSCR